MNDPELIVVSASLDAWATVPPETSITVRFSLPIEAQSAQAGIRPIADNVIGEVRLSADGKEATWIPSSPMPEGEHTLLVEDVIAQESGVAVTSWKLPFCVAGCEDLSRPYGQVLLHRSTTRLRISERQYSISKLLDQRSGERCEVAVDERGERVDLGAILREDERLCVAKYGRIHPTLYEEMARRGDDQRLPVAVWPAFDEEIVDKSQFELDQQGETPEALVAYRGRIREAQARLRELLKARFSIEVSAALAGAPVLLAELSPAQIRELGRVDEVAALFLHESEGILDIDDSMAASHGDVVVNALGWRGAGIRVAVWEDAADNLSQLAIQAHYDPARPTTRQHARLVTGIIRNTQPGLFVTVSGRSAHSCYAPASRIYAANSKDVDALDWAVTQRRCTVVNQSFHRRSEAGSTDLSFDDILKDYLALHYPFPTIVQAAGNYGPGDPDMIIPPADEYVNHKGFNSLTVGNHNDSVSAISGSSVFRNPATAHGDRELPELCANGTTVSVVGVTNSGTSFASPAVAGSVALLQQMDNTLASWPEGCRAILMAGAVNVRGRTWGQDLSAGIDARDGAGALDVDESGQIARSRSSRDNRGGPKGWDVGVFAMGDFNEAGDWRHSYRMYVPLAAAGGRARVKVALAWNANVVMSRGSITTFWMSSAPADYDLYIHDDKGSMVAWSSSWDNSYEIAEFTGELGRTYTVRIRKASGEAGSYYGLAWTVRFNGLPQLVGISK